MAVSTNYYNNYFEAAMNALFDHQGGTHKVLLATSGYTFVKTHDFRDDITNEVVGTGYTAGGITLAGETVTQDDTNDRAVIDFNDIEWTASTITARHAVFYKDVGTAATDVLWCNVNFGADFSSNTTTFRIEIDNDGFQALEAA